jgi:hypothetical protein
MPKAATADPRTTTTTGRRLGRRHRRPIAPVHPMTAPRRRWFRFTFGLRTLFVLVTVLCVVPGGWVAYQLNWIRERHAFLDQCKREQSEGFGDWSLIAIPNDREFRPMGPMLPPDALRIFGEEGGAGFAVVRDIGPQQLANAERLFPEANFTKLWQSPSRTICGWNWRKFWVRLQAGPWCRRPFAIDGPIRTPLRLTGRRSGHGILAP